jgi:hypothetical protein
MEWTISSTRNRCAIKDQVADQAEDAVPAAEQVLKVQVLIVPGAAEAHQVPAEADPADHAVPIPADQGVRVGPAAAVPVPVQVAIHVC